MLTSCFSSVLSHLHFTVGTPNTKTPYNETLSNHTSQRQQRFWLTHKQRNPPFSCTFHDGTSPMTSTSSCTFRDVIHTYVIRGHVCVHADRHHNRQSI